jgi:hypothetical protein
MFKYLFIVFCPLMNLFSQGSMGEMTLNKVKVFANSNGLFFDSLGFQGLIKQGVGFSVGSGVWMCATDNNGDLRVAAHQLGGTNHEFWPGPLALNGGNASNSNDWDFTYSVTSKEVENHQLNFKKNGYQMPNSIRNWPGSKGSPYSQILAPFVDYQTNDQIYTPEEGDYPYFQGDKLMYSISNDKFANHAYSKTQPLGVELHTSVYGFDTQDSVLSNAILVRYIVYNRSNNSYNNFRFSVINSFKIGQIENEYLGTDVRNKILFAYNDFNDATFQGRLVSLSCMALNNTINSTMYYNNNNDVINGMPVNARDFNALMSGKWKNGSALKYGGNGVDGSSNARFVYPFDTDSENNNLMWSEPLVGNLPGKRIGLMNFDSVTLNAGGFVYFDLLYNIVDENFNNIKQIGDNCLRVKQALIDNKILANNPKSIKNRLNNRVYPNPLKSGGKLYFAEVLENNTVIEILNAQGQLVYQKNLDNTVKCIILPDSFVHGVHFLRIKKLNTIECYKITIE